MTVLWIRVDRSVFVALALLTVTVMAPSSQATDYYWGYTKWHLDGPFVDGNLTWKDGKGGITSLRWMMR